VFFLKHLFHARQIRNRILELFERADMPGLSSEERRRLLSFVVVGGGPTSCEFVSELHDFLRSDVSRCYPDLAAEVQVTLVEAGPALLGPFDRALQAHARKLFDLRGIDVRTGVAVERVVDCPRTMAGGTDVPVAELSDGSSLVFGMMVWSAGLAPVKLVKALQLPTGRGGRLLVDGCCRVLGHEAAGDLFAIGDCAINEKRPLAQLAQVASQQGDYVAGVINAGGQPTGEFAYFSLGSMVSLGMGEGGYDGTHVGDPHGKELRLPVLKGFAAWLMWRGGYLARQVSLVNMVLIPMHWMKAAVFGRDISSF
jgi:NADH dehydrogenase FAD-containing subunit